MTENRKKYIKKQEARAEQLKTFPKFWVKVQAQTKKSEKYNYSKLVSFYKAQEMIYGVLNKFGIREKNLKHEFKQV